MSAKRSADGAIVAVAQPAKRSKSELALTPAEKNKALVAKGPARSSELLAPVMCLVGHAGEVFTSRFSPDGRTVASAGFDREIFLWNTYGECANFSLMTGHTGAIMDTRWSADGSKLFSASSDKTCGVWDAETGERIRKLRGHTGIVNACSPARKGDPMLATASDDRTVKIWDSRRRHHVHSFQSKFQLTAVAYSQEGDQVIAGGVGCGVEVWDIRKGEAAYTMQGHTDTITGLELSPDGRNVVSNAMDNTVRMWDVQPFASGSRLVRTFTGAQHNFEKNLIKLAWTKDGKHIGCGSADRNVYVWNAVTGRVEYSLPGHKGSVNCVDFSSMEPIVVSGSSDKKLYLGELHL